MRIGKIRNGVILISVGIVFLLNNLGSLPWAVWMRILSLWPVILIAIGIEKIFAKTRLSFLTVLSPLLFLSAILGPAYFNRLEWGKTYHATETYQYSKDQDTSLTKVTAIVQFKSGDLQISSDPEKLISSNLDYWKRKPSATYDYSDSDSSATIEIKDMDRGSKGWIWTGWGGKDWGIKLTDRVPIDLKIYAKATEGELDLSGLRVEDLNLDIKAANLEIRFGDQMDEVRGRIESKASKLHILIPEDMGLKIENHGKLTSTSFSEISILKYDDIYQTTNFEQASRKIILSLDGSVTRLRVESYQKSESI